MKNLGAYLLMVVLLSSCYLVKKIHDPVPRITDHKYFPQSPLEGSGEPFSFEPKNNSLPYLSEGGELDQYLKNETSTTAFLVIEDDQIMYENYYRGYEADQKSQFFSVSKSITSMLVGFAVQDGYIQSVDDPVTNYIKELEKADPYFQQLTLRHLLDMRSGLDFEETYSGIFSATAKLYMGKNQVGQIKKMKFEAKPGTKHEYRSIDTAVLGIALERAIGKNLGVYLQEKAWTPLGMEYDASWSLDDKRHQNAKAFCGLNATARDLAKVGRLYLNYGKWNGKQLLDSVWVAQSTTPNISNEGYQFQWYSGGGSVYEKEGKQIELQDSVSAANYAAQQGLKHYYVDQVADKDTWHIHYYTDEFLAIGILGQYLYVDPKENLIMVRLGESSDGGYVSVFRKVREKIRKGE